MNPQLIEEILDELDPIFQNADASAGIVRLLKEKGIVNDDELAPYLEQATTAGSIKWRATRLRLARLLESAVKAMEEELEEKQKKATEEAGAAEQEPRRKQTRGEAEAKEQKSSTPQGEERKPSSRPVDAKANQDKTSATSSKERKDAGTSGEIKEHKKPEKEPAPEPNQQLSSQPGLDGSVRLEKHGSDAGHPAKLARKPA